MDSVFRVLSADAKSETYILEDWSVIDEETIDKWVETLKQGVPDGQGGTLEPCPYDEENLRWSGSLIVESISFNLWQRIEHDIAYDVSGPHALLAIVQQQQLLNYEAKWAAKKNLEGLKLPRERA